MTLAADVKNILIDNLAELTDVQAENIHTFMIPSDDWTDDKPIILITEISNDDVGFGSNEPIETNPKAQVQMYYPTDYTFDMSDLEQKIKQILRLNGWYCESDTGHFITPDNGQIMATLKFNNSKIGA